MITFPEPPLAPVIPPVTVPTVQVNVLGDVAVSEIFGLAPLHVEAVLGVFTAGVGYTVTVSEKGVPGHDPVTEVGVIRYSTVPEAELLGLVSTWLMVLPEPGLAPVMPPVMVPIVQVKVLGALAVKEIFGLVPLQVVAFAALVTTGLGLTVTVIM